MPFKEPRLQNKETAYAEHQKSCTKEILEQGSVARVQLADGLIHLRSGIEAAKVALVLGQKGNQNPN